jgi:hypothetical protein
MSEQWTIKGDPPRQYCGECADTEPQVIAALELAYIEGRLHMVHDEEVHDQICLSCQRPIATVPAPFGTYEAEITVTIQCKITLSARSAAGVYYSLRPILESMTFERAQAEVEGVLVEEVQEAESAEAYESWCALEDVQKVAEEE